MAVANDPALKREIESAWKEAAGSFSNLKKEGKLSLELWNMLQTQASPLDLLNTIKSSKYANQPEAGKLLKLAEGSIDVIMRFDKEIAMVLQGLSNATFGASCIIWGGLGVVFHISQDIFKTPEVIVEIIAKIFVMMPRIDLCFELFRNKKDTLDIRPLLVRIYRCIVDFNVQSIIWYSKTTRLTLNQGSSAVKILKSFKEDPRAKFRAVFDEMTDASEEMGRYVETIGWKVQQENQADLIDKLAELEINHKQHIHELRDLLIQKHQEDSRAQIEKLGVAKVELERRKVEEMAAKAKKEAKARKEQEERLLPFMNLSELRQSFWQILHKEPWAVIVEEALPVFNHNEEKLRREPWRHWKAGKYHTEYPTNDPVASILLVIDWKAELDPKKPSIQWMVDTPNSIFYPGKHIGRLEINEKTFSRSPGLNAVNSRLKIYWESGIFSNLPSNDSGYLSSVGPLEETAAPLIMTPALQSIAHVLIRGPFDRVRPKPLFGWHGMNGKVTGYFKQGAEDKCMRACAFFANAFTRDLEGLEEFGHVELTEHGRESSILAILELAEYFKIDEKMAERAATDGSWRLKESYAEAESQEEWVERDRLWVGRIVELVGWEALVTSSKEIDDLAKRIIEMKQKAKVQSKDKASQRQPAAGPSAPVSTQPALTYNLFCGMGKNCLDVDGLPKDWSPLHRAVWHGDINNVMSLADQRSVNTKDSLGWTPLHLACSDSESTAFTFRQIFPRGLKQRLLHPNSGMCFPRRRNRQENALAMCRVIINAGAEVNSEASIRWLPMHNVASSGWVDLAHLLLENGGSAFSSTICSPYCWVDQDRECYWVKSREDMRELLRAHISDEQMEQIEALHKRSFGQPEAGS